MRSIKTSAELDKMRIAARKSSQAHRALMRSKVEGLTELQIKEHIEALFREQGLHEMAYGTLVGAGSNSVEVHAIPGDRHVRANETVLVDAGGKWEDFCSDITRAFPAGKRFPAFHALLYSIVLRAQKEAIAAVRTGITLVEIDRRAKEYLLEGLKSAGLISSNANPDMIRRLMPHKTSHWIGRDVHDTAPYEDRDGKAIQLEEGMVFSIEPGLYLPGFLGVRVEDVIAVENGKASILTDAPKEVEEIELLRAEAFND